MLDTPYPTAVFCIIATEFCERFSFCGLRTILSLYLRNILLFSENASTIIYHIFIMMCYIIPVVGAIFADSYFGRYRTIRNFALIYLVGNILMCIAAVPALDISPIAYSAIGLLLIAIGTGGIKPCVAAFGAEQFRIPEQQDLLGDFFSIFYFTINLGGFVGMMLTPIMRKVISCFGDDTCYALGFGFPAALMILSIMLFIMGKPFYKLRTPKENVVLEFSKCTLYALAKRIKKEEIQGDHWLDYARNKFDGKLIQDAKKVYSIFWLYLPLPLFWSLFDQQGSRWTFQASHMDGKVFGVSILPDQMQVVNPLIVLILIPIFDKLLYPFLTRMHVLQNLLHRMAIGGVAAGLAFLLAGILEIFLQATYPELPKKNHASVVVLNTLPCDLEIIHPITGQGILKAGESLKIENMVAHNVSKYTMNVEAPLQCEDITFSKSVYELDIFSVESQVDTVLIDVTPDHELHAYIANPVDFEKSISGAPKYRISYVRSFNALHNVTVTLQNSNGLQEVYFVPESDKPELVVSPYTDISEGVYECKISSDENPHLYENHIHFLVGGVYSLVITEYFSQIRFVKLFTMSVPNSINILWQIPQYFLISVAEIMFGVAGLEFSFTQAPKSMKTVTIAGWYLSTAFGNFIVILVTQLNIFKNQANQFFLFAVLIMGDMMIFMEIASKYKFARLEKDSSFSLMHRKQLRFNNENKYDDDQTEEEDEEELGESEGHVDRYKQTTELGNKLDTSLSSVYDSAEEAKINQSGTPAYGSTMDSAEFSKRSDFN